MGLLSSAQITALETSQATLITEAGKAQTVLNSLYGTGTEHPATLHSAWRPLWQLHQSLKDAIDHAERVKSSNDDEYGEWKF